MSLELVEAARQYLNAGLTVMPLEGKAPARIPGATGWPQMAGAVETADDFEIVTLTFTLPDVTGIAIILSPGMAVVDVDGEEGAKALVEMMGSPPLTAAASTGRGLHLYYATLGEVRTTKLAEKLDLKGVGGYVAAPPSVHPSGAIYTWLDPLVIDGVLQVEWLPDAIADSLKVRDLLAAATVRRVPREMFAIDPSTKPWTWTRVAVEVNLSGLVDAVGRAKEGERNNMLNWAAHKAYLDGVPFEDAMRELGTAAGEVGLDPHEIRQTINSAYHPR